MQYLESKGITKYSFYKETGITRGILDQNNGISEENLTRFLAYYPDVNPEWIITGSGEMLKTKSINILIKNIDKGIDKGIDKNEKYNLSYHKKKEIIPTPCRECVTREETIKTQRELIGALRELLAIKQAQLKELATIPEEEQEVAPIVKVSDKKRKHLVGSTG